MGVIDWLRKLLEPEPPKPARKAPATKRPAKASSRSTTTRKTPSKHATSAPVFRPGKPLANDARWIRANEQVEFRGIAIWGGLIYIGTHLAHGYAENEPSLIDPALPVTMPRDGAFGDDLPYWPSYARITPLQRGVYLRWLAEGRRDPLIPIGYGFLILYGLERRLLLERRAAVDAGELPIIRNELLALASILGPKNEGFCSACEQMVGMVDLLLVDRALASHAAGPIPNIPLPPPPPLLPNNRVAPVSLRIGLGILARNGTTIPADWAQAWAWYAPGTTIRGPANRCPDEFAALFAIRYRERYGDGIVLDPSRLHRLSLQIRPTSAVLDEQQIRTDHLPDVLPIPESGEVGMLIGEVTSALDDYGRWIARYPLRRHSLAAWSWLPDALRTRDAPFTARHIHLLDARLGDHPVSIIPGEAIIRLWIGDEPTTPEKLDRGFGSAAAVALGRLGYGLEPDPRSGVQLATDVPVALFRLPAPSTSTASDDPESGDYGQVITLLQLAAMVTEADGKTTPRERSLLHEGLVASFALGPDDKRRSQARLAWQSASPGSATTRTLASMKRRIAPLTLAERDRLAAGLLHLVNADGEISPAEVTILQKLWKVLGRDPDRVAGELHAIMTGGRLETGSLPGALSGETCGKTSRSLAASRAAAPMPPRPNDARTVALDADSIARTMADSAAVSALLGDLLTEDLTPSPSQPKPPANEETDGLGALIRAIATQPTWSTNAFAALTEKHGLLPDAALDRVNEYAFELADSPLLIEETAGSYDVDPEVLAVVLPVESV